MEVVHLRRYRPHNYLQHFNFLCYYLLMSSFQEALGCHCHRREMWTQNRDMDDYSDYGHHHRHDPFDYAHPHGLGAAVTQATKDWNHHVFLYRHRVWPFPSSAQFLLTKLRTLLTCVLRLIQFIPTLYSLDATWDIAPTQLWM